MCYTSPTSITLFFRSCLLLILSFDSLIHCGLTFGSTPNDRYLNNIYLQYPVLNTHTKLIHEYSNNLPGVYSKLSKADQKDQHGRSNFTETSSIELPTRLISPPSSTVIIANPSLTNSEKLISDQPTKTFIDRQMSNKLTSVPLNLFLSRLKTLSSKAATGKPQVVEIDKIKTRQNSILPPVPITFSKQLKIFNRATNLRKLLFGIKSGMSSSDSRPRSSKPQMRHKQQPAPIAPQVPSPNSDISKSIFFDFAPLETENGNSKSNKKGAFPCIKNARYNLSKTTRVTNIRTYVPNSQVSLPPAELSTPLLRANLQVLPHQQSGHFDESTLKYNNLGIDASDSTSYCNVGGTAIFGSGIGGVRSLSTYNLNVVPNLSTRLDLAGLNANFLDLDSLSPGGSFRTLGSPLTTSDQPAIPRPVFVPENFLKELGVLSPTLPLISSFMLSDSHWDNFEKWYKNNQHYSENFRICNELDNKLQNEPRAPQRKGTCEKKYGMQSDFLPYFDYPSSIYSKIAGKWYANGQQFGPIHSDSHLQ